MENKWISFLELHLGNKEINHLSDDMIIEDDLGISGDDGYEFFEDFCKTFEIEHNNSKTSDFFHSEFSFWKRSESVKKKLTIGMLKKIIEQGSF